MEYIAELKKSNYVKLSPNAPFSANNNTLNIKLNFGVKTFETDEVVVIASNGDYKDKITVEGTSFTVPDDLLQQGKLHLSISLFRKGVIAHHWLIYPLIILKTYEDEKHLNFVQWCEEIELKVQQATETVVKLADKIDERDINHKAEMQEKLDALQSKVDSYFNVM